MWSHGVSRLWRAAYLRTVRSTFATVPFYRYRWAVDGRTDPVLVPGRTGTHGGAVSPAEVESAQVDLVPLAGGRLEADPSRGLGPVLRPLPPGALVAVLDEAGSRPPTDLPGRVRGCVLDPDGMADGASVVLAELTATLTRGGTVLAVGTDKHLIRLAGALPAEPAVRLGRRPLRELDQLDGGPYGLVHDRMLGYLGAFGACGRWHLDWHRVYARETDAGLAFTLLRQDSPRFVDVLVGGGVRGRVVPCPRHGTPVVLT
ncbi:MAG: hypothetical protein GEV28_20635 [Actinophytocola sp.]|uniref:hypothetical protein n=1 Tax=Actinophytocola sp. TaxID=1872138 RepID=UPI0013266945|nr:hypothetical protein [Actinophytocola sp.]MPZ82674.1 hypothetical protein [Actinophytocola sp.]